MVFDSNTSNQTKLNEQCLNELLSINPIKNDLLLTHCTEMNKLWSTRISLNTTNTTLTLSLHSSLYYLWNAINSETAEFVLQSAFKQCSPFNYNTHFHEQSNMIEISV